ncbi:type III pantothenate kinase [Ningiella sp. W23]|uniref:type III pantothenate kinase n=1 Tax=Ningiella sp. W23 TaxID=3023715 RepID=UPI003756E83B
MLGQRSLLLDLGNTKLKYAWLTLLPEQSSAQEVLKSLQVKAIAYDDHTLAQIVHDNIGQLLAAHLKEGGVEVLNKEAIEGKVLVYLCSVQDDEKTQLVTNSIKQLGFEVHVARSQKQQCGLHNSYAVVANMGSDRWLAMIAADTLFSYINKMAENDARNAAQGIIIVDAGTAITCDLLLDKNHLGGWIAPGLGLLREAITSRAKRVFDFEDKDNENNVARLALGNDTPACVANGAFAQLCGMVVQASRIMRAHTEHYCIVISGGDSDLLAPIISEQVVVPVYQHSNLVLAGLARLSFENEN